MRWTIALQAASVLAAGVTCLLCLVNRVEAYIPATATNNTATSGINLTDTSLLELQWYPMGEYSETVSYQLAGSDSDGISKGALVHFSEENLTKDMTTTPWIALVSCDGNATDSSEQYDIFTLAQHRGAVAALLYSQSAQTCAIDPAYADPATWDGIMDIFTTKSLSSAQFIQDEFSTVNQTLYSNFDALRLNESEAVINDTIVTGVVPSQTYLFATLMAANATPPMPSSTSNSTGVASDQSTTNTDVAMIVLYVITGAVSLLFCIVILSGAIRAIRHPERYGPRAADPTLGGPAGQGQSRARGLTRAIVDTFPIIKFTRAPAENIDEDATVFVEGEDLEHKTSDLESAGGYSGREAPMEMKDRSVLGIGAVDGITVEDRNGNESTEHAARDDDRRRASTSSAIVDGGAVPSQSSSSDHLPTITIIDRSESHLGSESTPRRTPSRPTHTKRPQSEIMPAAIGRDTCPICILDFEEGDDLRVLPCEGKHVFHQHCVDPWLLELSSSCPICRQDFQALETMLAGDMSDDDANHMSHGQDRTSHHASSSSHLHAPRFSRYLRFARSRRAHGHGRFDGSGGNDNTGGRGAAENGRRRRQWGNRESIVEDPTDPPMPMAVDTSM